MGGILSPKPKGPSAEQQRLQAEQTALAKKQAEQLEEQEATLAQQELQSKRDADQNLSRRNQTARAARLRKRGRASLIKSGSELGATGTLG